MGENDVICYWILSPVSCILTVSYRKDPPMPLYEYLCKKCDKTFTITMTIGEHDKKRVQCPGCKSTRVTPQFQSFYAKTSRKS